ncbi:MULTISPECIES: alcohol dehydrogenase AdhP [unclassified Colwellia]|jgi:propanol-preferring alcohol dehydrogenase|uniref:alcohol dehydrogenase AdhP n=1 Tax=unclassified Colwellia TaxID=196834 RepID=UPI0015F687F2|nr:MULTISPECIES: alcohol dehydrogenase AdhP [unclassified Colwellia]MBA6365673.1 alcohol dehydrogenase AdhP [Colwellia sp. BRX8-8]MBA6349358.1 alcohol dehydrogenase AdhP [Colwellia sp. BRX8-9]MBA6351249.1 alcohol dehydrogenase AdhP [Colwellia sp. BRX9-1]MBA6354790.1 alcohol dehydrogenase AdhP [Colwellia sp. BRX8-3]MBA6361887.1 alcohol dehydrogenase AdhP [Colwellia sp. BRX8-6]|tara:strand:- start:4972 stop:5982 length:1011 start_codon:yes stop_codon:yes gene_type:complete
MKAAVIHQFKDKLEIKQLDKPTISSHEVLVKVHACGVCHTDLHACHGDWPVKPKMPLVPGHEGVGEIVEVGEQVKHLNLGDRVGIPWLYSACGYCDYCLSGNENLCLLQQNAGYSVDGSYAEYCKADGNYVVKIPDEISYVDAAPLFCAGVTTYKALKVSTAKPGEWVAIFGIGGLGHLAVQYAVAMGLNVIAIDTGTEKLKLAKDLGASFCLDFKCDDVVARVLAETGGVHASICTAVSKSGFEQSYQVIRRGGKCVLVGLPAEDMPLPIFDTVLNGVSVVGSIVGTRKDLVECLDFAARGKVKAITIEKSLEDINDIFEDMINGEITGRVVMKF